jgi:hypothetical protein
MYFFKEFLLCSCNQDKDVEQESIVLFSVNPVYDLTSLPREEDRSWSWQQQPRYIGWAKTLSPTLRRMKAAAAAPAATAKCTGGSKKRRRLRPSQQQHARQAR